MFLVVSDSLNWCLRVSTSLFQSLPVPGSVFQSLPVATGLLVFCCLYGSQLVSPVSVIASYSPNCSGLYESVSFNWSLHVFQVVSEFSVSPESVEVSNGLPESPMVSHCSFASIYYVRMCEQSDHVHI